MVIFQVVPSGGKGTFSSQFSSKDGLGGVVQILGEGAVHGTWADVTVRNTLAMARWPSCLRAAGRTCQKGAINFKVVSPLRSPG
jgi:hypothetical protein